MDKRQNPNEAFNNCIWRKAPKDTFVACRTLEVAVASAVIHFNDGGCGILKVTDAIIMHKYNHEALYFTSSVTTLIILSTY